MAEPITDRDREQVRRLHAEGKSRNAIARAIGRSAATVSKIAGQEGLTFSGGARVAAATEARRADAAARRELLADESLDGALRQVERVGALTPRGMPATMPPPPARSPRCTPEFPSSPARPVPEAPAARCSTASPMP